MSRAKVRAGGILRTAADVTWRTPRLLRERVQAYYRGVPFLDPACAPDNPPTPSAVRCPACRGTGAGS